MKKVAVVIGTRPCIIKQFSPYNELKKYTEFETLLVHSGQHDDLGVQAQQTFGITPDYVCNLPQDTKFRLGDLVSKLISEFTIAFYHTKPDLVLVHGDTSTAFSAATAAFLQNIPIGHVEAGLRTSCFETPFPEEGFRRQISRVTSLHFAPTSQSKENLNREGTDKNVYVVGNSVVDSVNYILNSSKSPEAFKGIFEQHKPVMLVTCHRRESWTLLEYICESISRLAIKYDIHIIWPYHSNPKIKDVVFKYKSDKIHLVDPLEYCEFIHTLKQANIILTDSGGVLEEASILGKPTLVLRNETERPEALSRHIKLVGYNFNRAEKYISSWLLHPPKFTPSDAFGEGDTGEKIASIINNYLKGK